MKSITHCRICVACTMIFLQVLLLVSCAAKKEPAILLPAENVTMQGSNSDMPVIEETSLNERPLIVESDYDVNSDYILLQDLTIPSFDFLSEFKNLREITITDSTIAENIALPHTIEMAYQAYLGLPQEDRNHFNFGNNDELDAAHIFCR